jgi:hypothetical protein
MATTDFPFVDGSGNPVAFTRDGRQFVDTVKAYIDGAVAGSLPVPIDLGSAGGPMSPTEAFALTSAPSFVTGIFSSGAETAITITGLDPKRWAWLDLTQPASGLPGTLRVNGQTVTVDPTLGSTTTVWVKVDFNGLVTVTSSYGGGGGGGGGSTSTQPISHTYVLRGSANPFAANTTGLDWIVLPKTETIQDISISTKNGTTMTVDVTSQAPGGATTTVFTTQSNRPQANSANGFYSGRKGPDVATHVEGTRLSFDVDDVGGPGGDLIGTGAISTSNATGASRTVNVAMPSTTVPVGSLLVMPLIVSATIGTPTVGITGWTLAGTREYSSGGTWYESYIYYRLATGSEGTSVAVTLTAAATGAINFNSSEISALSNPNPTATLDDADSAQTAFGTSHSIPANTATVDNTLRLALVRFVGGSAAPVATPTSMTKVGTMNFYMRKVAVTAPATTGTDAITASTSTVGVFTTALFKTVTASAVGADEVKVLIRTQEV